MFTSWYLTDVSIFRGCADGTSSGILISPGVWLPTRTSVALEQRQFPIFTYYNGLWCRISLFWSPLARRLAAQTSAALELLRFPIFTNHANYNGLWYHISYFWHQDSQFDNYLHWSKKYINCNKHEYVF